MATDLIGKADPTRPRFVSGQNPQSIKGQPWQDDHYPGPDSIDRYARDTRWGENITEHPHTFYEKEVLDYDPGASDLWSETLIKTWDKLWKAPNILGSFIWEWQNQGIADKNADATTDFWYGPDHLRQENNKGVVTAYRVPKPGMVDRQERLQPGCGYGSHRQSQQRHLHGSHHEPLRVYGFKRTDLPLERAERGYAAARRRFPHRL